MIKLQAADWIRTPLSSLAWQQKDCEGEKKVELTKDLNVELISHW